MQADHFSSSERAIKTAPINAASNRIDAISNGKRNLSMMAKPIFLVIGLNAVSVLTFHDVQKIIRAITNPVLNDSMIEVHIGLRPLLIVTSYIFVVSITPNSIKIKIPPT